MNSSDNNSNNTAQEWKEMREERMNNDQDPVLQTPQDANTGKHINFQDSETAEIESDNAETENRWEEMRGETKNNDRDPG